MKLFSILINKNISILLISILLHIHNNIYINDIICWYLGENHVYMKKLALIKNHNLSRLEVFARILGYKNCNNSAKY